MQEYGQRYFGWDLDGCLVLGRYRGPFDYDYSKNQRETAQHLIPQNANLKSVHSEGPEP